MKRKNFMAKVKVTPITTVPELSGLLDRRTFYLLQDLCAASVYIPLSCRFRELYVYSKFCDVVVVRLL